MSVSFGASSALASERSSRSACGASNLSWQMDSDGRKQVKRGRAGDTARRGRGAFVWSSHQEGLGERRHGKCSGLAQWLRPATSASVLLASCPVWKCPTAVNGTRTRQQRDVSSLRTELKGQSCVVCCHCSDITHSACWVLKGCRTGGQWIQHLSRLVDQLDI